jgi:hypothetical protein
MRIGPFSACDAKKHRAEHEEGRHAVRREEADRISGIQCGKNAGIITDVHHAERGQHQEPDDHQRAEDETDLACAARLRGKEDNQNGDSHGHHIGLIKSRDRKFQAFHGGQNRHSRRQNRIAIEESRARNTEQKHGLRALADRVLGKRHEREHTAFALVVGAHDEDCVLDRHHEDQCPEHQRDHTEHF